MYAIERHHICFNDLNPIEMCFDCASIEDVQWCTIVQHYATSDMDYFTAKSVDYSKDDH